MLLLLSNGQIAQLLGAVAVVVSSGSSSSSSGSSSSSNTSASTSSSSDAVLKRYRAEQLSTTSRLDPRSGVSTGLRRKSGNASKCQGGPSPNAGNSGRDCRGRRQ